MNNRVSYPTPTLPHCILSIFVLRIPALHARCGRGTGHVKKSSVPQVCIPLILPLVIDTSLQAVAQPNNTKAFCTYFAMQHGENGVGRWEIDRAVGMELLQS